MKNYIQRGDTITVAAPATTTGGAVVTIGELVGIRPVTRPRASPWTW